MKPSSGAASDFRLHARTLPYFDIDGASLGQDTINLRADTPEEELNKKYIVNGKLEVIKFYDNLEVNKFTNFKGRDIKIACEEEREYWQNKYLDLLDELFGIYESKKVENIDKNKIMEFLSIYIKFNNREIQTYYSDNSFLKWCFDSLAN